MAFKHNQTVAKEIIYFDERNWLDDIARWVSQIGSPPIMTVLTVLLIAAIPDLPRPLYWATYFGLLVICLPSLYVLGLLKQGKIADIQMPHRHERVGPFLVSTIVSFFIYGAFVIQEAPYPFILLALANLIQTVLYLIVNLYWKISVHANMAVVVAIVGTAIGGGIAFPLWLLVPLICWARLYSQRHTIGEVIAGIIVGITVFGTIFFLGYP